MICFFFWFSAISHLYVGACQACDFSFVFRKARDTAARKLSRSQTRKRWGRGKGERTDSCSLCLFSLTHPLLLFHLTSYFTKHERKTQTKPPPTRGYINSIPSLSHVKRKQNFEVSVFQFDDIHILNSYWSTVNVFIIPLYKLEV